MDATAFVTALPSSEQLSKLLSGSSEINAHEDISYRPLSLSGLPGGLLDFCSCPLPLIVVPDLHARYYFLQNILSFTLPADFLNGTVLTVKQALEQKKARVICVGDGLHSEMRGAKRWAAAWKEYRRGKYCGPYMVEEMQEGLSLMCLVMECRCRYPGYFHFLKGNHENIENREGGGDYPFVKFAEEGAMTAKFMFETYGSELTGRYAAFERSLPLAAVTPECIVSHAEPQRAFTRDEIINCYAIPEVISGLTWTANGEASATGVRTMIDSFIPRGYSEQAVYLAGHRPVAGTYALREDGAFIQIHNPALQNIALVYANRPFNPAQDLHSVENSICQKKQK